MESTGYFVVALEAVRDWTVATPGEAARVRGRNTTCPPENRWDGICCAGDDAMWNDGKCECAEDEGGGGAGDDDCQDCEGMPRWRVSEPLIHVWVEDIPITYRPTKGPLIRPRVALKQFD